MAQSQNNWPSVINLGNSIIGVAMLAMPFCFKTCGIVLGLLLLLFCTWLTIVSCQLLMKAGVTSRRRSYGFLAYHTHGAIGKLVVEIGMIGLQFGTLVAQIVIIGDLGPAIVSKFTGIPNSSHLRVALIITLCVFVGLPLGMLKNLHTLSRTSTLCIIFYSFFTIYVFYMSIPNLISAGWYSKVNLWRNEGLFQCLPIFSFAFGCQTQLFIVYDQLAEPSLKRINVIVRDAVNMCTLAYIVVGFFGYIAFHLEDHLSGDILNHFVPNIVSDTLKLCFVFSVAVTIPLIVFPCRASLYTLLFPQSAMSSSDSESLKPKHNEDLPGLSKIPELHFKLITAAIVLGAMTIGILVPNVEFVLGINGATMGTMICYIFPALFFLKVMSGSADGKGIAKLVLVLGVTILLVCTYTTLSAQEKSHHQLEKVERSLDDKGVRVDVPALERKEAENAVNNKNPDNIGGPPGDVRLEPPNPRPPDEKLGNKSDPERKALDKKVDEANKGKVIEGVKDEKKEDALKDKYKAEKVDEMKVDPKDVQEGNVLKQEGEKVPEESQKKQEEILKKLEEQQVEQKKLIKEQKEILEELKQHKEEHVEVKKDLQGDKNLGGQQANVQQQAAMIGQNVQQQPNLIDQNLQKQPALIGQNIPQQPNMIGQNVQQQPAMIGQNVQQQPNMIGQNIQQQPNLIGQNVQQQPNLIGPNLHLQNAFGQGNIDSLRDLGLENLFDQNAREGNLQQQKVLLQGGGQAGFVGGKVNDSPGAGNPNVVKQQIPADHQNEPANQQKAIVGQQQMQVGQVNGVAAEGGQQNLPAGQAGQQNLPAGQANLVAGQQNVQKPAGGGSPLQQKAGVAGAGLAQGANVDKVAGDVVHKREKRDTGNRESAGDGVNVNKDLGINEQEKGSKIDDGVNSIKVDIPSNQKGSLQDQGGQNLIEKESKHLDTKLQESVNRHVDPFLTLEKKR